MVLKSLVYKGLFPGPHRAAERVMTLDSLEGSPVEVFSADQPVYTGRFLWT